MNRISTNALIFATLITLGVGCTKNTPDDLTDTTTVETQTNTTAAKETSMSTQQIVTKTVSALFVDFDAEAAKPLIADDYIQHNPHVPTGAAPVLGFVPGLKESGIKATPHRMLVDGDLVVMHSTYENAQAFGGPTLVAFDVFRVEDGKVAEHWDNLQPPVSETVSGRSMTDGATEVTDLDKTDANRALVTAFATDVLINGQFDKLADYVIASPGGYIQHNPFIGDGLDGLGAGFAKLAEQGKAVRFTKVHKVIAQGNFVLTMSEGTMGETPTAFYDLFRVEGGKIVEHWDVIQAIPPAAEFAHGNGKF